MLALVLCVLPAFGQGMLDDIQIHGLVSQGYMRSTDNNYLADTENGSFEFSEAIVNFSTQVSERLRVGLQVLARDLGKEGNSIVGLDWAYGDYRWRRNLGLRFGKLKSHIGLYNKGRDVDMLRTSILLPQSVYEETTRDFAHSYNGVSVYGSPLVPGVGRLNYEVYAGTLPVRDPDSDFWRNNLRLVIDDLRPFFPQGVEPSISFGSLTVKYVAGGMLTWHTPLTGLRLSGNFMKGDIDASARLEALVPVDTMQAGSGLQLPLAGVWREELGIDIGIDRLLTLGVEYSWRDLLLAAELLSTRFDIELDLMTLTIPAEANWQGTYLMANYRVSDLLELGTYYAQFYPDKDDKGGQEMAAHGYNDFEAWREDIALSARFDVGENWLLKLETHRMDGASQVMTHANPDGLERNWYLFLAKISAHF
jgi:hypothetical protein